MIFVDTNVFMYLVGKPHPLRALARESFKKAILDSEMLCTSAEVLQELMHAYLPVGRLGELENALNIISRARVDVWPLEEEDVRLAQKLHEQYESLEARDLCHLASCRRRGVREIMTFDAGLRGVVGRM